MISIIAAVAKNNVIGKSGELPWYIPEDLKRFKDLTSGHIVIMGRTTHESILKRLGHDLPNRKSVVITSNPNYQVAEGVEKYKSLDEAIDAHRSQNIFLIGGQRIFEEGIKLADKMYLTEIHKDYDGDVYFPEFQASSWDKQTDLETTEYSFVTYTKKV
jgi:dihydrofolate reductase